MEKSCRLENLVPGTTVFSDRNHLCRYAMTIPAVPFAAASRQNNGRG
jgi:hypothetical protein